jgi:phosphoserine phosphatase RsbU/P
MTVAASLFEIQAVEKLREEELEEARAIQNAMFPVESLRAGDARITHEFQPVASVGGDFLDYFQLTDGSIGLYLGDVSGKGLPAAMYAALAVGALRGVHKSGEAAGKVLSTLNRRLLVRGMPRRYSATQYAVFDPRTREMHIASAGLPGPFHISQRGCRALDIPGMPVGLFEVARYETAKLKLEPGDAMIFCTDGITEAFNIHGESFGCARVARICEAERKAAPPKFLSQIFAAVERFTHGREQHDDMAAVVFQYLPRL